MFKNLKINVLATIVTCSIALPQATLASELMQQENPQPRRTTIFTESLSEKYHRNSEEAINNVLYTFPSNWKDLDQSTKNLCKRIKSELSETHDLLFHIESSLTTNEERAEMGAVFGADRESNMKNLMTRAQKNENLMNWFQEIDFSWPPVKLSASNVVTTQEIMAFEQKKGDHRLLVIGCRPWDKNIEGVEGLSKAHFVDFIPETHVRIDQLLQSYPDINSDKPVEINPQMLTFKPEIIPDTFHHLDLNDSGVYGAGKFSEYAAQNPGAFDTILIDWVTYQHVRRDDTWKDFANLLSPEGTLIFPFTCSQSSRQTVEENLDKNLAGIFSKIEKYAHKDLPAHQGLSLLTNERSGGLEMMLTWNPVVIFAHK